MSFHSEIDKNRKSSFHWDVGSDSSIKFTHFLAIRPFLRLFTVVPLVIFLCFSVVVISCSLYVVTLPLETRTLYRRLIVAYVAYPWIETLALLLPQTKIYITEDSEMPDGIEPGIIIVNHQFERDWWTMFGLMRCVGQSGRMKVLLPEEMRHIPLLGWALQLLEFPFLGRSWAEQDHLSKQLSTFNNNEDTFFFLFFPEGARLDQTTHDLSLAFAHQENRPMLSHLLLPNVRGFQMVLEGLKNMNPAIYDVTMVGGGYVGEATAAHPSRFTQFMALLLDARPGGRWRHGGRVEQDEALFLRIRRYSAASARQSPHWLDRLWELKDAQLEHFSRHGAFPPYRPLSRGGPGEAAAAGGEAGSDGGGGSGGGGVGGAPAAGGGGAHRRHHRRGTSVGASAPVRAMGKTRHPEASLLALVWLLGLPWWCPALALALLPAAAAARAARAAGRALLALAPAALRNQGSQWMHRTISFCGGETWMDQSGGTSTVKGTGRGIEGGGSSTSLTSPFVPQTPFCSPSLMIRNVDSLSLLQKRHRGNSPASLTGITGTEQQ